MSCAYNLIFKIHCTVHLDDIFFVLHLIGFRIFSGQNISSLLICDISINWSFQHL